MSSNLRELTPEQERKLLHLEGPYSEKVKNVKGIRSWDFYLISLVFIFTDGSFIYYMFYITISIIGLVQDPIFLSLLLLDFAVRFDMIKNAVKNKYALGMTGMLILIILFIYTSFGFFYFHDRIYKYNINAYDSDLVGESLCDTVTQCYMAFSNHAIRIGGGIGDSTKPESFNDKFDYFIIMFFNATFHIFISLIMMNIVFGIIIDTFAQIRSEKREMELDQLNKCFICNLDRYLFDQDGNGFDDHCENDHNMWNYIFYIVHLQTKDPTEFNGVESYVWNKLNSIPDPNRAGEEVDKEGSDWVPLLKAMAVDSLNKNLKSDSKGQDGSNDPSSTDYYSNGNNNYEDGEYNEHRQEKIALKKLQSCYQKLKLISQRVNKMKEMSQ